MPVPTTRPEPTEYAPYYDRYISLVPGDDILGVLSQQLDETLGLLGQIPEDRAQHRYEPGKWSIAELVGHVVDTERIFGYRALRIARNDRTPIEGFDQDEYARWAPYGGCRLADVAREFELVRRSTLSLLGFLDADAWRRRGVANDVEVSVRALAFIVAGHERHHVRILRERYL